MRNSESDNEYPCNPSQRNLQTSYDFKECLLSEHSVQNWLIFEELVVCTHIFYKITVPLTITR